MKGVGVLGINRCRAPPCRFRASRVPAADRKSTRLNSSHTVIYTLSLHDALPILLMSRGPKDYEGRRRSWDQSLPRAAMPLPREPRPRCRSEEHTSELQSHSDLHSFPTRRSSDLVDEQRTERL